MAKKLAKIIETHPNKRILAVVGAGHEEDIVDLIKKNETGISYTFTLG